MFGILIKHFYSQVMNIFVEVLNKNLGEISFSNKTKTEAFCRTAVNPFCILKKNFQKRSFRQNSFDLL